MKEYRFEKGLDFESNGIEKLNELAKIGWIVKIKVTDGILLEREVNEILARFEKQKSRNK